MRLCFVSLLLASLSAAQSLSPKWEDLTADDFVKAIEQARGTCILPFGILEKHGPTGPLGTDLINVRASTFAAVKQEYAVVFPEYYFGQIFEARHHPGTVAYSTKLQIRMLDETTSEMARNGCKKIVIINGHGGNTSLIQFYSQTMLETPKDYVVYAIAGLASGDVPPAGRPSKAGVDGHGGEGEMATVMATRADLVFPRRGGQESGADLRRLDLPPSVTTGIWWYSRFPNHYAGDASGATAERGEALLKLRADGIAAAIRAIKADTTAPRLQREFFDRAAKPVR